MADPNNVLSQTLHSITLTKIRELEKVRSFFKTNKRKLLLEAEDFGNDQRKRVAHLQKGVLKLEPDAKEDPVVRNIARFLEQLKLDNSFPKNLLHDYETILRARLDKKSLTLELADLYSRLLTEWMDTAANAGATTAADGSKYHQSDELETSFEILEKQKEHLHHLANKFEKVVFNAFETDEIEIDRHLNDLFTGLDSPDYSKELKKIRASMNSDGESFLHNNSPFTTDVLKSCIEGALAESLLNDDKQKSIREFMNNEVILKEIADVLNIRFANVAEWEWFAPNEGIFVFPRRDLNGKYRIWMDEDVLQAIFIYFVGMKWCVAMKEHFGTFVRTWRSTKVTQAEEKALNRWVYYTGKYAQALDGVNKRRWAQYAYTFSLPHLPASFDDVWFAGTYDDEHDPQKRSIKQQLLRTAATEIFLQHNLNGKVAVVQTDLEWFATALPHSTVFAVLRFFGVPEFWVQWFKKFLEAPLNMDRSCEGRTAKGPQIRKRGVPLAHTTEKLLGEMILFLLDFAVFRNTGILLYRMHDDIWFWGEPTKVAEAWQLLNQMARLLGLKFNESKTGSCYLCPDDEKDSSVVSVLPKGAVSIGILQLNPKSGQWIIDQEVVTAHVNQLGRQLAECSSVLAWVHTWNSCIGRFFGNAFGMPSPCFGTTHVDNILWTYHEMQERLFGHDGKKSLADYVKDMISTRFGVADVPDAFLWLPEEVGGLGLKNPFIQPLILRRGLKSRPADYLSEYLIEEKDEYQKLKQEFEGMTEKEKTERLERLYPNPQTRKYSRQEESAHFLSFKEFTSYRERFSNRFLDLYDTLKSEAKEYGVKETKMEGIWPSELSHGAEMKWIVELHREELLDKVGGLSLVPKTFLPAGILATLKQKPVTWRTVL